MQGSLFQTAFNQQFFLSFLYLPLSLSLYLPCLFAAYSIDNCQEKRNMPSGIRDARMFLQVFHGLVLSLKALKLCVSLRLCWMVSAAILVLACKPAVFTPNYKPSSVHKILSHSCGRSYEKTKAHTSILLRARFSSGAPI